MEAVDQLDKIAIQLHQPLPGVFVLDASELDGGDWLSTDEVTGDADPGYEWVDVLCDSSEVTITRGLNLNQNVFARAEAAEMVAVVHGPTVDPVANIRLAPNAKFRGRVLVDETWETLFIGRLRSMVSTYSKDAPTSVTISGFDLVDYLNNIQGIDDTSRTFANRLSTLATAGGTSVSVTGGTTTLAPIETYRSLWDQMNIAANSEGGVIYSNRQGTLEARGRDATASDPIIEFSDHHGAFTDHFSEAFQVESPLHSCYTSIDVSYDTTNITNSITISNISEQDENGEDVQEQMGTFTEDNSIQVYGIYNTNVMTNLSTTAAVDDLVDYVFDYYSAPFKRVKSITFNPLDYWQTLIDVGDYVSVEFHDDTGAAVVDATFMVSNVRHDIIPGSWEITLELFRDWTTSGGGGYTAPGWRIT